MNYFRLEICAWIHVYFARTKQNLITFCKLDAVGYKNMQITKHPHNHSLLLSCKQPQSVYAANKDKQ